MKPRFVLVYQPKLSFLEPGIAKKPFDEHKGGRYCFFNAGAALPASGRR
jgi:hypothetical protein